MNSEPEFNAALIPSVECDIYPVYRLLSTEQKHWRLARFAVLCEACCAILASVGVCSMTVALHQTIHFCPRQPLALRKLDYGLVPLAQSVVVRLA